MAGDESNNVMRADVLIIGGGLAGTWAALRAADFVDNVVLVDKARVSRSGCSTSAAGVMLAPLPGDDLQVWLREIVERGDFLNDQDWVQILLEEQIERIREMETWGTEFERDEKGNIARGIGRAHVHTRFLMFHGKKLMETMRAQVLAGKVRLVERVMITDLLSSDGVHPTQGKVVGALGFDCRSGEPYVFQAKATIVAAGCVHPKRGGNYVDNITGDGYAMGFRAGADLVGMEFNTAGHLQGWARKYWFAGLNMFQGLGAKFVNAQGDRFMERYDPALKERSKKDILTQAFCKEALEGRGPIYCDMRHFPPEAFERLARVVPRAMLMFDRAGIDPRKQMIEFTPFIGVFSSSGNGGIWVNTRCESNIPGLYGAGGATKVLPHGTFAVGGLNLAYCCVSGYRSGENAARYAAATDCIPVGSDQVRALREEAFAPMRRKLGLKPDDVFDRVMEITVPAEYSTFKHERRIRKTLARLAEVQESLAELSAPNPHELVKACEARNYVLCAELVFKPALERQETRSEHYREDYPYRDDDNWLKWLVLRRQPHGTSIRVEHIPIWRYPVKPETYGKKPAPVQFALEPAAGQSPLPLEEASPKSPIPLGEG
ncbi:MAG: FAD-binding protein [Chloroflexi bacterium]|nr:FAD-binding protein [Chloroflexota bacterium]